MPGNTPRSELERIYRLIQAEKLDEAVDALRPIVKEDADNEDAWWLLANAATDPAEAKDALHNVLRLNPENAQASKLVDQLHEAYPELKPAAAGVTELDWSPQDFEDVLGTSPAKPLDPFGDDREPGFAAQGELAKANFPQPEFFPEKFGDVPLHEPAGSLTGATGAAAPTAAAAEPPKVGAPVAMTEPPPDEPGRLIPILMGIMLVIVVIFGALYLLNRPSGGNGVTTTETSVPTSVALASVAPSTSESAVSTASAPETANAPATQAVPMTGTTTVTESTPTTAPAVTGEAGTAIAATAAPQTGTSAPNGGTPAATTPVEVATNPATASAAPSTPLAPLALSLGAIAEPFKTGGLADASATVGDSILGQTLTVQFCSKLGLDLLRNTDKTRDQLATLAAPYASEIAAIGIKITNCTDTTNVLYSKVVPIAVVKAYVEQKVDVRKYRASWINP
jgi:cytoskeletal protein RodZ